MPFSSFTPLLPSMLRPALLLFLMLLAPLASAAAGVCVIRAEHGVLLFQDNRGYWQLPGGSASPRESTKAAAEREAWEETGIRVKAQAVLDQRAGVSLFACVALLPVPTHGQHVSLLQAPHLGRESIQARWVDLRHLDKLRLRFPQQIGQLSALLDRVAISSTRIESFGHPSPFRVNELERVKALQALPLQPFTSMANFLGEFWFYIIMLPLLWWAWGGRQVRTMVLGLMLVTIIVQLGKTIFAVPRPFSFDPVLSASGASGFAMPSGHTASAMCFFTLCAIWFTLPGCKRKALLLVAAMAALATGTARVWLGVHYWSDVLAGVLVGGLAAGGALYLAYTIRHARAKWLERAVWAAVAAVSLGLGLLTHNGALALPMAVGLGCALCPYYTAGHQTPAFALWLLSGFVLIMGVTTWVSSPLQSYPMWQSVQLVGLMLMGLWIGFGAARSYARVSRFWLSRQ